MYADILRSITGVSVFPVISLLLFVAVFTSVLVWAVRADRHELQRKARLPLDVPPVDPLWLGVPDSEVRR